jgi:hypothetical protein
MIKMYDSTATKQAASPPRWWLLGRSRASEAVPSPESEFDPGQLPLDKLAWRRRYRRARTNMLARQYVKLRSDLLVAVRTDWTPTDVSSIRARRGTEYLTLARQEILNRRSPIYVCSSLLYLAEINLAWLYPAWMLRLRCSEAMNRLQKMSRADDSATWLLDNLRTASSKSNPQWLQAALADAFEYFSQQDAKILMADDLQVTRLRSLLWYVGTAFGLLVLTVPYVTTSLGQSIPGWPVVHLSSLWLTQVVSALAVAAIGAVGGIFSGLISTRDSSTTLDEYRTSMLKLALKPLVGAVASLTLYLLLSWQILTGVKVTNGGTFLLVGFLAGFSERYFLKLLRASPDDSDKQETPRPYQLISAMPEYSTPYSFDEQQELFVSGSDGSSLSNGEPPTAPTGSDPS